MVHLPIVDVVSHKPKFLPPTVPSQLLPRLQVLHGHPSVWWVGQLVSYLMRLVPGTAEKLDAKMVSLDFQSPIVGIHIRRSDKVGQSLFLSKSSI